MTRTLPVDAGAEPCIQMREDSEIEGGDGESMRGFFENRAVEDDMRESKLGWEKFPRDVGSLGIAAQPLQASYDSADRSSRKL